MVTGRILIRGGDVIDTEPEPVVHRAADVLVEDGRIRAVGPDLAGDGAEVIDASDRFVLPGFVDTHRHLWQTGLRSLVVDDGLETYFDLVHRRAAPRLRPEDLYVATLAGALECLDAGVTTVQDYSLTSTFEHGEAAVGALRAAGIRAVYGAGFPVFDESARRPGDMRRLRDAIFPGDDGPITMALAPVGPAYTRFELTEQDWQLADELGVPIVVHINSGPVAERPIATLRERGLLRPDTLYIHGNSLPDEELHLVADSGAAFSITPATETHFRMGPPMIARLRAAGIPTGLGVDVVTTVAGDMFSQMRAALLIDHIPAADALRMATLDGARALGLADRTGSLRPGKDADLILLSADDPNLLATHDPIAAVVTAAHPGNVDTVLVAGQVVKRAGRLRHPALPRLAADLRGSADHLLEPAPA